MIPVTLTFREPCNLPVSKFCNLPNTYSKTKVAYILANTVSQAGVNKYFY